MKAYKLFIIFFLPLNVILNLILFKSYYSLLDSQRRLIQLNKEIMSKFKDPSSFSAEPKFVPFSGEAEVQFVSNILDAASKTLNADFFIKSIFRYFSSLNHVYNYYVPLYFREFMSSGPFFALFLTFTIMLVAVSIMVYNDRYDNIILNQNKRIYLLESFVSHKFNRGLPLSVLEQHQWSPISHMNEDPDFNLDPMYEYWYQMRADKVRHEQRQADEEWELK